VLTREERVCEETAKEDNDDRIECNRGFSHQASAQNGRTRCGVSTQMTQWLFIRDLHQPTVLQPPSVSEEHPWNGDSASIVSRIGPGKKPDRAAVEGRSRGREPTGSKCLATRKAAQRRRPRAPTSPLRGCATAVATSFRGFAPTATALGPFGAGRRRRFEPEWSNGTRPAADAKSGSHRGRVGWTWPTPPTPPPKRPLSSSACYSTPRDTLGILSGTNMPTRRCAL
jgi:hypothetical protein